MASAKLATVVDWLALATARTVTRLRASCAAEGLSAQHVAREGHATLDGTLQAVRAAVEMQCAAKNMAGGGAWSLFVAEVNNSCENEAVVLQYQQEVWQERCAPDIQAAGGSLWMWLSGVQSDIALQILCEQWASMEGHPTHPSSKTRVWRDGFASDAHAAECGFPVRMAALAQDIDRADLYRWSPEFAPMVRLPLLALRQTSAHVALVRSLTETNFPAPSTPGDIGGFSAPGEAEIQPAVSVGTYAEEALSHTDAVQDIFRRHFPEAFLGWQTALLDRSLDPVEYVPMPVHPACLELLLLRGTDGRYNCLEELLADGTIALSDLAKKEANSPCIEQRQSLGITAQPMMSLRTLCPHPEGPVHAHDLPPHIKLPVPIQCTSLVRYVSPVEASEGPLLSDMVNTLLEQLKLHNRLLLAPEMVGVHLADSRCSYEASRYVSFMLRANSLSVLPPNGDSADRADKILQLPVAVLLCPPPLFTNGIGSSGRPMPLGVELAQMAASPTEFYTHYASAVLGASLGLYLRSGVALEMHQQNTLVELDRDTGHLLRLICREVAGGVYCFERTLQARGIDIRPLLHKRQDAIYETDDLPFKTLWHTTFIMHLLPLGRLLCDSLEGLTWPTVQRILVEATAAEVALAAAELDATKDSIGEEAFAVLQAHIARVRAQLLETDTVPAKSLLIMRILGGKTEMHTICPNPLLCPEPLGASGGTC